jgi:voltage-gated potassium channel
MTLERWDDLTEWPLLAIAFAYLVAYSWQVLAPDPPSLLHAVLQGVWAVFLIHYVVSLVLAPDRQRWFLRNLHELLIVALPMFRPLRLLRLLTTLNVLHRVAGRALRGRLLIYAAGASVLLVYVAALAMYDIEHQHPEAMITTFGDAIWWAIVSITTVGYGDLYPVTFTGRAITVALMIYGIALLGIVTATLASWLIQQVGEEAAKSRAATAADIDTLRQEIAGLRDALTHQPNHRA